PDIALANTDGLCCQDAAYDATTARLAIGMHVVNLYHGYQNEFLFPYDWDYFPHFDYTPPAGGSEHQALIVTKHHTSESDPGGWGGGIGQWVCCPSDDGQDWPKDGHGEIVGYRGPTFPAVPIPLGVRLRDSPQCGNVCGDANSWPARTSTENL